MGEKKVVKKGKVKTVREETKELEEIGQKELAAAVELLNTCGLLKEKVNIVGEKPAQQEELFLAGVESVPEAVESNLPDTVKKLYNRIVEELEAATVNKAADEVEEKDKVKKEEKKGKIPAEKEPAKKSPIGVKKEKGKNGSPWADGSNCDKVFQVLFSAEKKGISLAEAQEKLVKVLTNNDPKAWVRKILGECVSRFNAAKKDGDKYTIIDSSKK